MVCSPFLTDARADSCMLPLRNRSRTTNMSTSTERSKCTRDAATRTCRTTRGLRWWAPSTFSGERNAEHALGFVPTKFMSSQLDWRDPASLGRVTGDTEVSIAVTPNGLADALHKDENGTTYFVQPFTEKMSLNSFFARLGTPFLFENAPLWHADSDKSR